jgi:DNA-binding NtrC family response regulator
LDEITEMPLELQVKLLRVLETATVTRLGGERPLGVDVRVLAATNRPPEEALSDGRLREDLFYRLKVFPVHLPPLRERGDDIGLLAEHFLHELNQGEPTAKKLTESASSRLRAHHWPGNVRELKNVLHRAHILADLEIDADCLPPEVGSEPGSADTARSGATLHLPLGVSLEEAERRLILATVEQSGGDKPEAARILGVSLKTLYNRLNAYKTDE